VRNPDELTMAFRGQGLKITPQRQAVFRALHGNPAHPTAEAVHATVVVDLPAVSLRTVYQTLNDLAEMGEIHALDLGTGAVRFDPNLDEHHHVVCEACSAVRDVYVATPALEVEPDAFPDFIVRTAEIVFRGCCASCATATPTSKEA
jgi:Fe2+ or Zn2+ uptake regulation protein